MKIAILDDWLDCAPTICDWGRLGDVSIDFYQDTISGQALIKRLKPYQIICIMRERTPINAEILDALPNLQAIVTSGMRNAALDIEMAKARNIIVSGMAGQILPSANAMKSGGWQTHLGRDLRGARLGILGVGRLGAEIAGFGQAFGMQVQAWSQNLTQTRCHEVGVDYVDRETLFKTSDFISIHLKLSDRVRHLIGPAELAMMQPDASIVNTSRAPIIDMKALQAALSAGQIGGAAIDVYDHEPVPANDPVRQTPNLIMTPHIGYVTRETMQAFYAGTLAAIEGIISGKPVREL